MYWHDRSNGLIPTQAEWESAAHSSGPWHASVGLILIFSFLFACVIHLFAVGIALQLRQRQVAAFWAIGGFFGLVCSAVSFYLFGYLIE